MFFPKSTTNLQSLQIFFTDDLKMFLYLGVKMYISNWPPGGTNASPVILAMTTSQTRYFN